jgi:hypothetical protein
MHLFISTVGDVTQRLLVVTDVSGQPIGPIFKRQAFVLSFFRESSDNLLIVLGKNLMPMPVAARSKAWVYGRSLAGIVGLNPA